MKTVMFHPLENIDRYRVILASGSPRRRELLGLLDIDFTVDTSHPVDETVPEGMPVHDVPAYLSQLKAGAYPLGDNDDRLVITADTVVILDGDVLGKPADEADAVAMLERLSGREQTVMTGVTIRTCDRAVTFSATSHVEFAELSRDEIVYYVERYRPLDKAGAYGIQEWIGAAAIRGITGSFYNVMGLPVHRLYDELKKL
ncbi:MAG: Maf family nucleotide pyrophosphatase [Duncaniella sp.]|nr:Maf family nucleotide pyrophosphatase [Duncaniella sp.]